MTTNILKIHHSSLVVACTKTALDFYSGTLQLEQLKRPELPFPGAWLKINDQQIHLLELKTLDPKIGRPKHGGKDRHIAFCVVNLGLIKQNLERDKIHYTLSISGRKALFCRDPDGNALEFIENQD